MLKKLILCFVLLVLVPMLCFIIPVTVIQGLLLFMSYTSFIWLALGLPLIFMLVLGKPFIAYLKRLSLGQFIREDGPQSHQSKQGTPTGGGVLLLSCWAVGFVLLVLLGCYFYPPLLSNHWLNWWEPVALLVVGLVLCSLGLCDDALKIMKKHNKGLSGYSKLALQVLLGLVVGGLGVWLGQTQQQLMGTYWLNLGWWLLPFATLVLTGTSNAVNLTDGLDGLATGCMVISLSTLVLWFALGFVPQTSLVFVLATLALLGACLGFWWFNRNPAKVFMGDSGSLALGGLLATLCLMQGQGLWLPLLGGIFVIETVSVILQVASFKLTGKRIFKMAPLHHHFELIGWSEQRVVKTFIFAQAVFCALATGLKALHF